MEIKSKEIKIVDIGSLKPNSENPNRHSPEQIDRLVKILKHQGFRSPLTVSNQSGFIVVGHGRLDAAKKAGFTEVPVIFQDFASPQDEYLHLVADNSMHSDWAELDLSLINTKIPEIGPFDIDLLGLKDFQIEVADKYGAEDEVIEPPKEARTRLGDLYQLGPHRLLCGDSTQITDVERLMGGENADMVFTDPPYGISIDGDYGSRMKGHGELASRSKKTYSNIIGDDQEFDPSFVLGLYQDAKIFLWGANNYTKNLPRGSWLVWYKKTTEGLQKMFGWDFELCWTNQTSGKVYEQAWAGCFGHNKKLDGDTKVHPSMKSVQLICSIFSDHESNSVIDLFGGSGSTLIACEKTNRKCFMMELDPIYVDTIVERYLKFSKRNDVLLNGQPYSPAPSI